MRVLLVIILLAAIAGGYYYYTTVMLHPPDHEAIEKDFIAGIPTIFRTPGGNLELAAFKATETIMSADTAKLPYVNWNIPGATTTVVIRVPVIYRYHVRVLDSWEIDVVDNNCSILAPELQPTLPPAVQLEEMEISTFEGPLAWDGNEQQEKLLKSLAPQLEVNARDTTKLKLVREEARKTVAEFVQAWLLQRGEWGEKKIDNITVTFREEVMPDLRGRIPAGQIRE